MRSAARGRRDRLSWGLRLCVWTVWPAAQLLFDLRYRHAERIPAQGGVLLVANHVSILDPLACGRLVYDCGRVPRFLAKASVFTGLAGTILRSAGQIPVHRGAVNGQPPLDAAKQALDDGDLVVIYPEGSVTRDRDWWPMRPRTGVAWLALTTDATVLPVAQWGPQRVHDYHTKKLHLRLRTPVEYLVGDPVDLSALRAEVRAGRPVGAPLLREVTDLVMSHIRDQLGAVRGETPPLRVHPGPGRSGLDERSDRRGAA